MNTWRGRPLPDDGRSPSTPTAAASSFSRGGPGKLEFGTEFAMMVKGQTSWVEVYDGKVEVALLNEEKQAWLANIDEDGPNGKFFMDNKEIPW